MAAPRQGLPVRLERAPHRGAAFALSNASKRARTRSIGSRSRARGSSLIFDHPPAVAPRSPASPWSCSLPCRPRPPLARLASRSDPLVDQTDDKFVLRWSGFTHLETARKVYDRTLVAEPKKLKLKGRSTMLTNATAIDAQGKKHPPPPPQPTEVQRWMALAARDEHLAHALAHHARPGWYDAYKVIECLEDRAGGEDALKALKWVKAKELKRLKQTANSFRHRPGGKHRPPKKPVTPERARELLDVLIRRAFETVL
jgi:hypothetical protein